MGTEHRPAFVDEHAVTVDAEPGRVWTALREFVDGVVAPAPGPLTTMVTRLLGTDPPAGFTLAEKVPGERVVLAGRHRFSTYRLVFTVEPGPGAATTLRAATYADFPGPHGRAYRLLVVGSHGHALAVRRMLREVRRRARLS